MGCAAKVVLVIHNAKRQDAAMVIDLCSGLLLIDLLLIDRVRTAFVSSLLIRFSPYRIGHALQACRSKRGALVKTAKARGLFLALKKGACYKCVFQSRRIVIHPLTNIGAKTSTE